MQAYGFRFYFLLVTVINLAEMVESEETQDYICGMLATSPEEAEDLSFVPSALSERRGAIYFCDNRCSEKAFSF